MKKEFIMKRLENKVAIITGGSSGIGEEVVNLFLLEGAKVIIFDIKKPNNQNASFIELNINDEEEIAKSVKKVADQYGKIDILVNNAGVPGANKPTHLLNEKEWEEVFSVDVKGTFFMNKHVIPYMIKNGGGSIVNLCSVYGTHGSKGELSAYHAAKGSILAMSKQDAATYGSDNIRVNAILPGTIKTPLLEGLTKEFPGGSKGYYEYIAKRNPLHKTGEPKDVAYGVVYLASDEAKFVTGISLYIDGGYTVW